MFVCARVGLCMSYVRVCVRCVCVCVRVCSCVCGVRDVHDIHAQVCVCVNV